MSDIEAFRNDVSDATIELEARVAWFRSELWRDPRHDRTHAFVHDLDDRLARIQAELALLNVYLRTTDDGEGAPPESAARRLAAEREALEVDLEPSSQGSVTGGGVAGSAARLVHAAARPLVRELEMGARWWGPAGGAVPYMRALRDLFATLPRAVAAKLGYKDPGAATDWS